MVTTTAAAPRTSSAIKFSYVLPDPASYPNGAAFDADLEYVKQAGYDAVEIQIADPAGLDELRLKQSLDRAGLPLCAFQTGGTYATRGNCLCTADAEIRARTLALLKSFVDLAARTKSVIVFGSLQGRVQNEPDLGAGRKRIVEALSEICRYAAPKDVVLALEPVNHIETAYHHTIAAVYDLVQTLRQPSARMMVDTFHMNIEEKNSLEPLPRIVDRLVHVHLSETNRDVLGAGHWDTAGFLSALKKAGYNGYCSVGVYNTTLSRQDCIRRCMEALKTGK